MSEKGFVKIDRALFDHWIWKDKPFCELAAWIDLIGLANYKTIKKRFGDKVVTFKRGTVYQSILSLSDRWGWDRKKVKRFLSALESDRMVSVNSTTHGTTITIINYGKYQNVGSTNGTTNGQPMDNRWDNGSPQEKERKERKQREERKDIYGAAAHTFPPTLSEVSDYIEERGLRVTAEKFWRYYDAKEWTLANGRRMTKAADWHGALESWKEDDGEAPARTMETYQPFDHERKDNDYDTLQKELARKTREEAKARLKGENNG